MFQTKFAEKIKTQLSFSITCSRKSCCLWDNVEKYGRAEQATDDNIIRSMRFACWIPKVTQTHTHTHTYPECVIFIAFPRQQWLRERSSLLRCSTLPVLLKLREKKVTDLKVSTKHRPISYGCLRYFTKSYSAVHLLRIQFLPDPNLEHEIGKPG